MPKNFCLDENLDETLAFLAEMRSSLLKGAAKSKKAGRHLPGSVRSYFDFKTIERISPTAALVMASLYDRRKWVTGSKPYTVDEHLWPKNVLSVLRSVGFHELLEMRPQDLNSEREREGNFRVLKFISGERAEGEELGRLQDALVDFLPEDERGFLLYAEPYSGMLEAALNAHMWAYPPGYATDDCPVMPRWWMTGAIDTAN